MCASVCLLVVFSVVALLYIVNNKSQKLPNFPKSQAIITVILKLVDGCIMSPRSSHWSNVVIKITLEAFVWIHSSKTQTGRHKSMANTTAAELRLSIWLLG